MARLAVVGMVLAVLLAPTAASAAEVTGTVTDAGTGDPLAGAGVSAGFASTTTDGQGDYALSGLPAGTTTVFVSRAGYLSQSRELTLSATDTGIVDVALSEQATISGTVSGPLGPLAGVSVSAYDPLTGRRLPGFALTDGSGRYTISQLAAGSVKVRFEAGNFFDPSSLATQWAAGKPDFAAADLQTVTAGQDLLGVDALLVEGGGIAGTVTGPGGATITGQICAQAFRAGGSQLVAEGKRPTITGAGAYTINNLPPGDYDVRFADCDTGPDAYEATAYSGNPVTVAAQQVVTGIDQELVADTTNPTVTIVSGPGDVSDGRASFVFAADEPFVSFQCALDGLPVPFFCPSPQHLTFAGPDPHAFEVQGTDGAGNASATVTRDWETTQTAAEATSAQPIATSVTVAGGGPVMIVEGTDPPAEPSGYRLLDHHVDIEAPAGSALDPLALTFLLDESLLDGLTADGVEVFRDPDSVSTPVADCTQQGPISPVPCISARVDLDNGDVRIVVLTDHASGWSFGAAEAGGLPDCSNVTPDPDVLWPPNGRLVPVTLSGATDAAGDALAVRITEVAHDEGAAGPDSVITPDSPTVELRATRAGTGGGRSYVVQFAAEDEQAQCTGAVSVVVPHDRRG